MNKLNKISQTISECRACGGSLNSNIFNLGYQALTGHFLRQGKEIDRYNVSLALCKNKQCELVQVNERYDIDQLYGDHYGYESSLNPSMIQHLSDNINKIESKNIIENDDIVIDIGSNDGTSLGIYSNKSLQRIGVDPTAVKFKKHYQDEGITLFDEFFPSNSLSKFLGRKKAKVITSFACFYDLPSPSEFVSEIKKILDINGLWCTEQSYLFEMLKTNSFDTMCHEHLEYYSIKSIDFLCELHDLEIKEVDFNDINGGSSILFIGHKESSINRDKNVDKILKEESLTDLEKAFKIFKQNIDAQKENTIALLTELKEKNQTVFGIGASTKGNVLLQYYEIDKNLIPEIGEVNPNKFNCQTPGSEIPIKSEEEILAKNPDYLFILPWHFKNFFLNSEKFKNKKLIFPLPVLQIIET